MTVEMSTEGYKKLTQVICTVKIPATPKRANKTKAPIKYTFSVLITRLTIPPTKEMKKSIIRVSLMPRYLCMIPLVI
jgi:hypothetical protein